MFHVSGKSKILFRSGDFGHLVVAVLLVFWFASLHWAYVLTLLFFFIKMVHYWSEIICMYRYICHQYFLITISSTRCTPVSNWSNRPFLSGGNSSCSWVFYSCTGPKGWILTLQEGCWLVSPVSIMQSLPLSTLWCTLAKGHKQAAFHVRFIEKLIQWYTMHKSQHWIVDTHAITTHSCTEVAGSRLDKQDKNKKATTTLKCNKHTL